MDINFSLCTNLKEIKIDKKIVTCVTKCVLSNCSNLESLDFLTLMPNLSDLSISGCRNLVNAITSLVEFPHRLRFLDASKINLDFSNLFRFMEKSPYLEVLNVVETGEFLRDEMLIESLHLCPLLQTLHVTNCVSLTDKFVEFLLENKPPLLQLLALTGIKAKAETVALLQKKYPLLQIHFVSSKLKKLIVNRLHV